jgi:predicted Ser/Thr protein kinase
MMSDRTERNRDGAAAAAAAGGELVAVGGRGLRAEPDGAPRAPDALTVAALTSSIERLEDTLDQETALLEAHKAVDFNDFNRRKSRSLLELSRIVRGLPARIANDELGRRLESVRAKLAQNQDLLRVHLAAVQEIADVLAGALREAESDGTYSTVSARAGRPR